METVKIKINDKEFSVKKGTTVLKAATDAGFYIPGLCAHPDLRPESSCRLCVVQIEGQRGYPVSCSTEVSEGMRVKTDTDEIRELRKGILELLLLQHPSACLMCERDAVCPATDIDMHEVLFTDRCVSCFKNNACELQKVVDHIGLKQIELDAKRAEFEVVTDNPIFDIDYNLCVLCGRCIRVCSELMDIGVVSYTQRGNRTVVSTPLGRKMKDSGCKYCGACVQVCPTGSLVFKANKFTGVSNDDLPVACVNACPAGIDVPRFISLMKKDKNDEAFGVLCEGSPFPATLGRICTAPCEKDCWRNELNDPIAIRILERFLSEKHYAPVSKSGIAKTGKKIAVEGSGPGALTAAYFLALKGHDVTVFAENSQAGGFLRTGFSATDLPADIVDREIASIISLGVLIKTGEALKTDGIVRSGFDAAVLTEYSVHEVKPPVFRLADADGKDIHVIDAVGGAKKAADAVDKYLGGTVEVKDETVISADDFKLGMEKGFADRKKEIQDDVTDTKEALYEASRCLRCDLRHKISKVKLPGEDHE